MNLGDKHELNNTKFKEIHLTALAKYLVVKLEFEAISLAVRLNESYSLIRKLVRYIC